MKKINLFLIVLSSLSYLKAEVTVKNFSSDEVLKINCFQENNPNSLNLEINKVQNLIKMGFEEYVEGEFNRSILKENVDYYSNWISMSAVQTEKPWIDAISTVTTPLITAVSGINSVVNSATKKSYLNKNIRRTHDSESILNECANQPNYTNEFKLPRYVFERIKNHSDTKNQKQSFIQKYFTTNSAIFSIPAWNSDGIGLTGSHDGGFYLMNQSGYLIKRIDTGFWVHATPNVLRNKNFVMGSYDSFLYVISSQGEVLQKLKAFGHLFSTPLEMDNGDILVGDESGIVSRFIRKSENQFHEKPSIFFKAKRMVHTKPIRLNNSDLLISSVDRTINRLDETGRLKFTFVTEGPNLHSEAVEDDLGQIYIGSYDGHLYILSPELKLISKIFLGKYIHGSAGQLSESTYAVGSTSGEIVVFDNKGNKIRSIQAKGKVVTNPLKLTDGSLLFGSFDGHLYKVGLDPSQDKVIHMGTRIWSSPTYTPNKKSVVISGFDGRVYFLDPHLF